MRPAWTRLALRLRNLVKVLRKCILAGNLVLFVEFAILVEDYALDLDRLVHLLDGDV